MLRTFSCVRTWSSGRYNNPMIAPFKVLARKPKFFQLQIGLQKKWISIDRLKPAHILSDPTTESRPSWSSPVMSTTTRSGRRVRPSHL
ncbi:hypothetical protein AVEN_112528-1 [Araneus ventricosus]|uniref:Uncharacterized protein n=1 Tax=Araneus ventricosus TaxID=182803 RepID=A0A4Y2K6B4_ARAVE|nr:hypothetical protein AVEN_112528-1 [Araneus ventricosus]